MRVIDILDKYYEGEKIPYMFELNGSVYRFIEGTNIPNINFIYENEIGDYWLDNAQLSDEVRIVDNKLTKIDMIYDSFYDEYNKEWVDNNDTRRYCVFLSRKINDLIEKIREIEND